MSDQGSTAPCDHEWFDSYQRFSSFSPESVRDGCHPGIMEHLQSSQKAIVLVHGLSDSPYFMAAINPKIRGTRYLFSAVFDHAVTTMDAHRPFFLPIFPPTAESNSYASIATPAS